MQGMLWHHCCSLSAMLVLPMNTASAASSPASAVVLNGQHLHLPVPDCTLADLLHHAGIDPTSHATAVNGQFVPRQQRAQIQLHAGDTITCFQAITGG